MAGYGRSRSRLNHNDVPIALAMAKQTSQVTPIRGAWNASGTPPTNIQHVLPSWLPNQPPVFHWKKPGLFMGSLPVISFLPYFGGRTKLRTEPTLQKFSDNKLIDQ
jgi:hypothetical protein